MKRRPMRLDLLYFEPAQRLPGWYEEDDPRSAALRGALRGFMLPMLTPLMRETVELLYYQGLSLRAAGVLLHAKGRTPTPLHPEQVARVRDYTLRHLRRMVVDWAQAVGDDYTKARIAQAEQHGVRFDEVVRGPVEPGRDGLAAGDG